jgi:hypothetical protein
MLGFLHLPKNKGNYSHMKAINIISMEWIKYYGANEYKSKSTLGFGITTSKKRGSAMETLFMMMAMEIDVEAFNILVSSPLVWWWCWRSSRRWLWRWKSCRASLRWLWRMFLLPWLLPSLYRLRKAPQWPLGRSLWPKEGLGMNGSNFSEETRIFARFRSLGTRSTRGGMVGHGRTRACKSYWS